MRKIILCFSAALCFSGLASASLIEQNGSLLFGTGLGSVPTIVTVQSTGNGTSETGCVALIGGSTVMGNTTCQPGYTQLGAMVGINQTQTVSGSALANGFTGPINSYANLALVVNVSQSGSATPLTLNDLSMIITDPGTGAVFRSSGITGPDCTGGTCTLTPISSGTGSSGTFVFTLNTAQQQGAALALGAFSTAFQVGAYINASNAVGSPETVYLGAVSAATAAPEPATYGLLGAGMLILAFAGKRLAQ